MRALFPELSSVLGWNMKLAFSPAEDNILIRNLKILSQFLFP